MENSIIEKYKALLEHQQALELALSTLPKGYISRKTIKGKPYCYLQQRLSGRLTGRYLKADEIASITAQIALRKKYEEELPQIVVRLGELEQAARLMDRQICRELLRLKISAGMDKIDATQKAKSSAFANAMNAIEGVSISSKTAQEISDWQNGNKHFLSVFEATLKQYGFPTEV